MGRVTKARVEGELLGADTPERSAARVLDDAVTLFQQHFPEDWGICQNWPLQHGIPHLIAKLRSVKE